MLELNLTPFPVIQTDRLTLRQLRQTDASDVLALRSDDEVMKYIGRPRAKSMEDALQLINQINDRISKNESINWAITLKGVEKVIGIIGYVNIKKEHFRAEVGYLLETDCHRKGIMQESLYAVLDFGFKAMMLHSIEAITDPNNGASQSLLKKNKFIQEAFFKEDFYFEEKFLDSAIFSLLDSEFYAD